MSRGIDLERLPWLGDVPVDLEAVVSCPGARVAEVLALGVGSVVMTNCPAGGNVTVLASGAQIGAGELSTGNGRALIRMARFGGAN
jgi:flagellar motor switch/type III secretory pathway protein FliN